MRRCFMLSTVGYDEEEDEEARKNDGKINKEVYDWLIQFVSSPAPSWLWDMNRHPAKSGRAC